MGLLSNTTANGSNQHYPSGANDNKNSHRCRSIDATPTLGLDEFASECDNERASVAHQVVLPFQRLLQIWSQQSSSEA